ncbi:MAG: cysteine desulfurase family protein [Holophagae bacterium]
MDDFIYLDCNATTPTDPRVAEAMAPFLTGFFGNPSSGHRAGREAKAAIEGARSQVAGCLGCAPGEIVFTSGGSESDNLALRGVVAAAGGGHVVTSAVEHPAVLETALAMEMGGLIRLTVVGVDDQGRADPDEVAAAIADDTVLVSIMLANNEVGTLQPVAEIAARCRSRGVLVHTDAAQAVGKIPVDVEDLGVDLLTVAGHKLYAPKGIGALFVREGVEIEPLIHGAGHERRRRAGTENILEIVGLGAASEVVAAEATGEAGRLSAFRDRLRDRLTKGIPDIVEHAARAERLPNTLSVSLPGVRAGDLLTSIGDRLAASAGAACHGVTVQVSHVLAAMGVSPELALGTVRFSVGRFTTDEEVDRGAEIVLAAMEAGGSSASTA